MKKVKVEDALGMILAHDITEVIPGKKKDVAFKRGKRIEPNDIERLLDLGKRHIYAFDGEIKGVHEDEAGLRIAKAMLDENMEVTPPKEGKVNIVSKVEGLFYVDLEGLYELNRLPDVLVSTVQNRHIVRTGDIVAASRITPLYIEEKWLRKAEDIGRKGVIRIEPFRYYKVGLVVTGSEVVTGRIKDGSYIVEEKIKNYGNEVVHKVLVDDEIGLIRDGVLECIKKGANMVITTGGLSVDPDDVTLEGIRETGAEIHFYGTPVFPGAMFLVAELEGVYILGAPACVYFNKNTVFDLMLVRIMAGERPTREDVVKMSYGGLCLNCPECHYPVCFFGKGM
ncbi:MAG: molybdopterin-binding protein [Syntrophorhabdaceae bacterium]|nr:molybdopterin-binding protein [Syntrophorhabdaceae bacterium]